MSLRKFPLSYRYFTLSCKILQLKFQNTDDNYTMARILNTILCTAMAFFLTFAWAVYVLKDSLYATVAAVTVAVCVCLLVYNVLCKWDKHKDKKKNKKRQLADLFAFLQFNADNATLFSSLLTIIIIDTSKNIWVIGGNTILSPLLDHNLVDYIILQIAPVLLGQGIPLFSQKEALKRFHLKEVKQYGQFAELVYTKTQK